MRYRAAMVLLLLAACAQEAPPPADVLPRETFQELLLEAQLLEAGDSFGLAQEGRSDSLLTLKYDSLFAAHGTTKARFTTTFDHYAHQPEELKRIYEAIVEELGKRKDEGR